MLTAPMFPPRETGVLELIGTDEVVDQNEFGAAVSYSVTGAKARSGIITAFTFISTEEGTGAILLPAGQLLIFDADPGHNAGDDGSGISADEWKTLIAAVDISSGEWTAEDNGAFLNRRDFEAIQFHEVKTLYFVWRHRSATSFNDAAGDDEGLFVNVWLQLMS